MPVSVINRANPLCARTHSNNKNMDGYSSLPSHANVYLVHGRHLRRQLAELLAQRSAQSKQAKEQYTPLNAVQAMVVYAQLRNNRATQNMQAHAGRAHTKAMPPELSSYLAFQRLVWVTSPLRRILLQHVHQQDVGSAHTK